MRSTSGCPVGLSDHITRRSARRDSETAPPLQAAGSVAAYEDGEPVRELICFEHPLWLQRAERQIRIERSQTYSPSTTNRGLVADPHGPAFHYPAWGAPGSSWLRARPEPFRAARRATAGDSRRRSLFTWVHSAHLGQQRPDTGSGAQTGRSHSMGMGITMTRGSVGQRPASDEATLSLSGLWAGIIATHSGSGQSRRADS
jgi:hypothetical protein